MSGHSSTVHVVGWFTGPEYKTQVWLTAAAVQEIFEYQKRKEKDRGFFLKRLKHYARAGFRQYEGREGKPIKAEFGIYRISDGSSLYRAYGDYENHEKQTFFIVDAFLKHGRELRQSEADRIRQAAKVAHNASWNRQGDTEQAGGT